MQPAATTSEHRRSELKTLGAQCLYSFMFSAAIALVLCALTPHKPLPDAAVTGATPSLPSA